MSSKILTPKKGVSLDFEKFKTSKELSYLNNKIIKKIINKEVLFFLLLVKHFQCAGLIGHSLFFCPEMLVAMDSNDLWA